MGLTKIPYHIISDVKFDLSRKARLVAGGHKHKEVPAHSSYASVVSRCSVSVIYILAVLDDLNILAGDIGNTYLNALFKENVHAILRNDLFGPEHEIKRAIIVRVLYGIQSTGNAWREYISTQIRDTLGYKPCKTNPKEYMKTKKMKDGTTYYSYIVVYVDDILCICQKPKEIMDQIGEIYLMKDRSIDTHSKITLV